MIVAIVVLLCLGLALGAVLGLAAQFLAVEEDPLEQELQAMLPGSQCGQCGFVGCAQAAAALARGEAPVTLCPPGGRAVAEALAKRLGLSVDLSDHEEAGPRVALIHEELCIGCTKCLQACNVDAILGSAKQMHDVIESDCHGCGKCAEVCPTQAIELKPIAVKPDSWHWPKPASLAFSTESHR